MIKALISIPPLPFSHPHINKFLAKHDEILNVFCKLHTQMV